MRALRCIAVFLLASLCIHAAEAHNSKAWRERLAARTVKLWVEGQALDNIVLNSRGELNVTWAERGLYRYLEQDRDVDEWLVNSLHYYFSNSREVRDKMKGRDVFVLNCRAVKNWHFSPTNFVVGDYQITSDDILTRKEFWNGTMSPGDENTVAVAAPSLKPGQKIEFRYGDASAAFEAPRR